jgi:hypothetical protein
LASRQLLIRRHSAEAELEAARLQDLMLEPWQSALAWEL